MQLKHILAAATIALTASAAFAQSAPAGSPPPMNQAPGVLDHAPDFKGPPPSTLEPRVGRVGMKGPEHRHFPDPEMRALHDHVEATWAKLDSDKAKGLKSAVTADKDALIEDFAKMRAKREEFIKAHRGEGLGHGFPRPPEGGPGQDGGPPPVAH
ncbi:hypothetical protein [Burkholderia cenocepacia]|uniref:hypothetical protein n=1 Tax=Burkholderia cenocepacia TaxID=95486 RepID=UPI00076DD85E|nr:hypothetical protein [Burkholderia cenocepacia]KWU19186.1 hypothetical protein AS149_13135 [Burkholderia cenocepacia]